MIGIKKEKTQDVTLPIPEFQQNEYRTIKDAIQDLEEINVSLTMTEEPEKRTKKPNTKLLKKLANSPLIYNHISTNTRQTALNRFKVLRQGENFHNLDPDLKTTYSLPERTQNTIYMRLKYDQPSNTVVNVRKSMWIHPTLDRAISIREAARLQSFPDSFIFKGDKNSQYQQVGNAVPPLMGEAIAISLLEQLGLTLKNKNN